MSREILRPTCLNPIPNTFCPGCLHSMANKLVGQCIDELGLAKKTIVVMSVGCSTMGLRFWHMDMVSCAHGRAPLLPLASSACSLIRSYSLIRATATSPASAWQRLCVRQTAANTSPLSLQTTLLTA